MAEVETARAHMVGLIEGWLGRSSATKPSKPPVEIFPKALADLLTFESTDKWTIVRPKEYLGSETFAKIAAIVRDHEGEYISAGKESHFRLPR